jgi:cellobiose-specific phosphotransferase system component IIC
VSTDDNRIFYWLGTNAVLLVVLQPWLMRLSRVVYIRFFIRYDKDYKVTRPKEFE